MIVIEMRGDQQCALAIPGQAARLVHKIECDQESNVAISALETEDVILAAYRDVGAYRQSRFLAPQRDQPLEEPQERTPVVFQRLDVALFNVWPYRKPWVCLAKAAILAGIPTHWCAFRIAVQLVARQKLLKWISDAVGWNRHLLHAEFVAGIAEGRALQGKQ